MNYLLTWTQNAVFFTLKGFLNELNCRTGPHVLDDFVVVDPFAVDANMTRAEQDEAGFHAEDDAQTTIFDKFLKINK